jgi:hypothetical protein
MSKRSKSKGKNPPKDTHNEMQRITMQARTTLMNIDMDHLTPAECIFFEDSWMTAFETVHGNEEENSDYVAIRSVIVEEDEKKKTEVDDRRNLRGSSDRELWFYNFGGWFDIWAYIEISCVLCGSSYDDDDYYYNRLLTVFDDDARENDLHHRFETLLCDMLREGKFESFRQVQDCEVTFPF